MDSRKYVLQETLRVAVGEAVCVAAMYCHGQLYQGPS